VRRWSLLIIVQRDATQSSLFIILQVHSTCFGFQPHPSSEVHKTVTKASGTVQLPPTNMAKLAWPHWREVAAQKYDQYRRLCGWHPKYVEWTCRIIPYILESNPRPFYSFRGLKIQTRSWAEFWKNDRAAVRAVRTIQHKNLLFYLLFILYNILYNIYNLLFIRLAVITHNWIIIRHPVTIIFIFTIVLP